jgi:pimeloyl-ACP methyl ester carboxylesterase
MSATSVSPLELAAPAAADPDALAAAAFPGARAPDRERDVDAHGIRIHVVEWGDASAPPVLLAHGGFDFARTFDVFAPMLAGAGWRVVSWDHRGHGDSEHALLYSWVADTRDALAVLDSTSEAPIPWIGHSKGGALLTELAIARPDRVTRLINIDGLPSARPRMQIGDPTWLETMEGILDAWLASRARASAATRQPGTLDELARRRQRMNPRLSLAWLRYLATVGARRDADGWRWKIDPVLRMNGFGPWRPQWTLGWLARVRAPMLAILGRQPEEMGFGADPDELRTYLPTGASLASFDDVGHFVHIERSREVADLALAHLSA